MWPVIYFDNLIHQQLFNSIRDGNEKEIENLSHQVDWKNVPFNFYYLNIIYNKNTEKYYDIHKILNKKFNKPQVDCFQDKFNNFEKFNEFCESGNLSDVIKNVNQGNKWHIYSSEPIETSLIFKNFDIADFLMKNGVNLTRWPRLLIGLIQREYDIYCHFSYGKAELTGDAPIYAIKHGAILNYLDFYSSSLDYSQKGITALDLALEINHQPVIDILNSFGAKTAKELLNEQHQEC